MKKLFIFVVCLFLTIYLLSNIIISPQRVIVGQQVTFSIDKSNNCSSCSWDFGDGSHQDNAKDSDSVTHIYTKAGSYTVKITFGGCQGITPPAPEILMINVVDERTIGFTPHNPKVHESITFTLNNALTNVVRWNFGDGSPEMTGGSSITHVYNNSGSFKVSAKEDGFTQSPVEITLNISPDPRLVNFSPQSPRAKEEITFNAKAFKSPNILWDFGDGTKVKGGNIITHTYLNKKNYNVKVFDYDGKDEFPITFKINVVKDSREIIYNPSNPSVNEDINFEARFFKSQPLLWDFGDGAKVQAGTSVKHAYTNTGNYTVKVYENGGKDNYPIELKINISQDLRNISFTPVIPTAFQYINFEAKSFKTNSLLWDFGDGTKKQGGIKISHFYRNPGTFEVKVSEFGSKSSKPVIKKIQITKDKRNITWEPKNPVDHEPVNFKLILFNTNGYMWRFGDRVEKRTSVPYITHTYNKPGTFTLRVYDTRGKFGTPLITKITISKDQRKVMSIKRTIQVGEKIFIKAIGFNSNVLLWDFGDGVKKSGQTEESHIYLKTGKYKITVKDKGGQDKKIFTSQIQVLPDQRKIEVSNPTVGIGEKVLIKALIFYSEKILWDFGDGVKKIGKKIETHYYREKGEYLIKAIDYAGKGKKTFTAKIKVIIKPSKVSALAISGGELFFTNSGKNYSIAYLKQKNLTAKVRLKYEGTGIISAYWKIDDKHYKLVNQILSFGQSKVFSIKNIPTIERGLHKISFWIKSPKTEFELKGYYFVSPLKEKIRIIVPKDQMIISTKKFLLKWKALENLTKYKIVISHKINNLFEKPAKDFTKRNTKLELQTNEFSDGKYFWFVKGYDKNDKLIACSDINSFIIKK